MDKTIDSIRKKIIEYIAKREREYRNDAELFGDEYLRGYRAGFRDAEIMIINMIKEVLYGQ